MKKMPWRSEELLDIIGDNLYHDKKEAAHPKKSESEISDLDALLYKHCEELTDVQHIKLRQALEALYNQRMAEVIGEDLFVGEEPLTDKDIAHKYYNAAKAEIRTRAGLNTNGNSQKDK